MPAGSAADDREILARLLASAVPPLRLLHGVDEVIHHYKQLVVGARSEVLVFSRPPFRGGGEITADIIVAGVARHVSYRCLHEADQVLGPGAEENLRVIDLHARAGVLTRIVDELPIKLAVIDRRVVLLAMPDGGGGDDGFPVNLLIEDAGFARFSAESFERWWALGRPCPRPRQAVAVSSRG